MEKSTRSQRDVVQSPIDFSEMCQRMSAPRGEARKFGREAFDI